MPLLVNYNPAQDQWRPVNNWGFVDKKTPLWVTFIAVAVAIAGTASAFYLSEGRPSPVADRQGQESSFPVAVTREGGRSPVSRGPGRTTSKTGTAVEERVRQNGQRPGEPAVSGNSKVVAPVGDSSQELTRVTTPPTDTLAMLSPTTLAAGAEFDIRFIPYGYGPGSDSQTLAVRITAAKQTKGDKSKFTLDNRNVLLHTSGTGKRSAVAFGGTYSGKVVVVPRGAGSVLELRESTPRNG